MSNIDFLNKLDEIMRVLWDSTDVIQNTYYPGTDIYDFATISLNSEYVHWVFVTNEGKHISDAKPTKEVFDMLGIEL